MSAYPTPAPEPHKPDSDPDPSSRWVGRVFRWATLDSTNEAAFRALEQGVAQDGDAFVALEQTQGRGRRGSQWRSAPGLGLYASFVLRPERAYPGPMVTISAGLATKDAVERLGLAESRLKWPNDLLVGPSKLAGILVESRAWSPKNPVYVLGVGINVGQRTFPGDLSAERPVVSLAQLDLERSLPQVENALFACLGSRLGQAQMAPAALARDFLAALGFGADPVHVETSAETTTGRLASLDFERGLEIYADDGRRRWIPLEHIRSVKGAESDQG